jgi:hypothetical protein
LVIQHLPTSLSITRSSHRQMIVDRLGRRSNMFDVFSMNISLVCLCCFFYLYSNMWLLSLMIVVMKFIVSYVQMKVANKYRTIDEWFKIGLLSKTMIHANYRHDHATRQQSNNWCSNSIRHTNTSYLWRYSFIER